MYFKLALRSARQSIKDYLIYIVTLTICVALFYAFLSISSSFYKPDIGQEFNIETLIIGLFALVAGIALGTVCSQFITAMLLQMFQKPFRFSFMLFPDTVLLTVAFFCLCFAVTGLFQVRMIRKIKIIDMLRAERENEDSDILFCPTVFGIDTILVHRMYCCSMDYAVCKCFMAFCV